ncbi:unnamed protein product [Paramecium pentaurelia]|uniref:Uncharacterized protein n=1 Tax=Paramecium pentaurelia TaxID=43138 RepID=A0A8S1SV92_9CILI|nr:unnamed protein product [Paramecium pentaurelia]
MDTLDHKENNQNVLLDDVSSNMEIFQFLRKQKNYRQKKIKDVQQIFENGPRLAIIKPCLNNEQQNSKQSEEKTSSSLNSNNQNRNLVQKILDALSSLSDNQSKNKVIKQFLSVSTTYAKYERMKLIEKYISDNLIQYLKDNYCVDIFKQLNELYKMQLEQQIQNVLFFEAAMTEFQKQIIYNSAFLASCLMNIYSSKLQQNIIKQRLIFLNLTGLNNKDDQLHKEKYQDDCLYISLQRVHNIQEIDRRGLLNLNQSNFKTIYFEEIEEKLTWKQFRIIYKFQIKKLIKNFKSNLFILSIAKQLNNENHINFTEDCIKNMIKKFSFLAKDRLIIHSYISSCNGEKIKDELITYINCLQQGILSQEILLSQEKTMENKQIQFDYWIQSLIKKNKNGMNIEQQELIQREIRNQILNSELLLVKESSNFKLGIYFMMDQMQNNQKNYRKIYLFYNNINLKFLNNTILYVDYIGMQIALLQYDKQNYFVYYTKDKILDPYKRQQKAKLDGPLSDDQDIYCERINLSEELQKQKIVLDEPIIPNSSLIVKNQKIYIIYVNKTSEILMIDLENNSINVLQRKKLKINENTVEDNKLKKIYNQNQENVQNQIKDRRKPTIVYNPCIDDFDFIIFGGEFKTSNQFCNLIELLKVESQGFSSVIIPKEILYQKCNYYIPWPNMIVLVNDQLPQQYILLPGDYNNKIFYYNQVINKEHQEKAILITYHPNITQFQFDYLKIVYDNDKNIQPLPIQYFSGNQRNFKNPKGIQQQWYLAITLLESISSKIRQLFIQAEIEIKDKQLIIKQSITYDECNMILDKQITYCEEYINISNKQVETNFQVQNLQAKNYQKEKKFISKMSRELEFN